FVYVPNPGADQILQFRLDGESGKLMPLKPAVVKTEPGTGPRHFFIHPKKPFAYCCNEKGSSVTGFSFDPQTGRLKAFQTLTTLPRGFTANNSNADIEITPDGKFLYASNRGHDSLAMYRIDQQTGRLTALGQVPTEKTPREFNIDPTGRFVYSAGQGSGKMVAYRIQPSGKLKALKTYTVGRGPAWVLFIELPGE
ncbi:MAG: beta-propeller fold lactonase family protein, partial [Planctomycetes bacterium]|nr:beta-propeller fold lactonase family protein [Planctomycetota bacterium]